LLFHKIASTFALVCLFLVPSISLAQSATIISPVSNKPVTSPVRVVAQFPPTAVISSITVSVDGATADAGLVTPLDVFVQMSPGDHLLQIQATQADGTVLNTTRWVKVVAPTVTQSATAASTQSTSSSSGKYVYNDIEQMSGWYLYPDQGHPVCSATPTPTSNPSLDGVSGKFYLGPTGQYNNCLWPIKLGSNSSVMNFQLDTHYQISKPSSSQGIEFSSNHHVGTKWYKFSVQCSYNKGVFSVWDTAGARWSATSIPCKRPASGTWDHLTVNTAISGGKAVFQSLTLNGKTYSINKSFYPISKPSSYSYGVHFQMDGNLAGNAYYVWVDNLTFTAW